MALLPSTVLISEVGPREGLQSVPGTLSTVCKRTRIDAPYPPGVREIECVSCAGAGACLNPHKRWRSPARGWSNTPIG
jgi:hypothetical protein